MTTQNTIIDTENAMDTRLEVIVGARWERVRAEEQNNLDAEIACEAAKYAAMQKCIRRLFYIGNQVSMFISGVSAVLAVLFFVASDPLYLTLAILGAFAWFGIARVCDKHTRKKKGGI